MEQLKARSLLKQLGFGKGGAKQRVILNSLLVNIRVIDEVEKRSTTTLRHGGTYGFGVELVRNLALWPVEVRFASRVSEVKVLSFRDGKNEWITDAEALPNRGVTEQIERLNCHESQAKSAFIRSTITIPSGDTDGTTLDVAIVQ